MTDSMVDRVAAAILAAFRAENEPNNYIGKGDRLDGVTLDGGFDLKSAARAAITAMREPTEEMKEAVRNDDVIQGGLDDCNQHDIPDESWRLMIDAALTPAPVD